MSSTGDVRREVARSRGAAETRTARAIFEALLADRSRPQFDLGGRPALVNVDVQQAFTRPDIFGSAYATDPQQIDRINRLARRFRRAHWPVIWTRVAYERPGDAGVWSLRPDTLASTGALGLTSAASAIDPRCEVAESDHTFIKRMPSAFFETPLASLLTLGGVDTVVITGGSTSGCVRATVVDAMSRGYRVAVPIECVADSRESAHFANLTDIALKYGNVATVEDLLQALDAGARREEEP